MKKILCTLGIVFLCSILFAQESEEIELPEVVTVITGETVKAGLDSIPDFAEILSIADESESEVPILTEIEIKEESDLQNNGNQKEEKTIYAEGQLGGGFPSLFIGDFSVYRLNGVSPFSLNFHHNSSAGYSGTSLTDGFNNRDTSMSVEKTVTHKKLDFTFGGLYETMGQGLQNKVENISDINNDLVTGFTNFCWNLPKNAKIGIDLNSEIYNRYADITGPDVYANWIKNVSVFSITPAIFAKWNKGGFNLGFDGNCWVGNYSADAEKVGSRGDFGVGLSWENLGLKLNGKVDLIFGNTVNGEKVIAPFDVGLAVKFPVAFSNRKVSLSIDGGLASFQNSVSNLEKEFKYTGFSKLPDESSEWFGKIDFTIPIKTAFTSSVCADYRLTAFDNGRYIANYETVSTNGIYGYECKNIQMLTTDWNLAYHYKLFSVTAGWHSNWIDVPVLESSQMILINMALQSEVSVWAVNLLTKFCFGNVKAIPIINMDGYVQITPAVRLVTGMEDVLNLFTGEKRMYAGEYVGEGGKAFVLVKFFF